MLQRFLKLLENNPAKTYKFKWIHYKKYMGLNIYMVQHAPLVEISLAEEIPAETVVSLTKSQLEEIQIKKNQEKRILKLFISHFLDPVKVQLSSERENYYKVGNVVFKKIHVRGIITGVNVTNKNIRTHVFSVDDGTATLDCFLIGDNQVEDLKIQTQAALEENITILKDQPNNIGYRAALMMLQSSKEKFKKFKSATDFCPGDTVEVIGRLTESNEKRNCFVQSICKVDPIYNSDYIEDLNNMYETVYTKDVFIK